MSIATVVAAAPTNQRTFADLVKTAGDLGSQVGKGKDSFTQLLLIVHETAFLGGFDVDPNKHGMGIDDAQKLTEAYVKGQSGNNIFDAKALNQRVTASKVRTVGRLGMWPKGGQGEPLRMVNSFMTLRQQMRKDPTLSKKLEDPSNALVNLARAQLKRDHVIPASEFKSFLLKKDPDVATEEDVLESIRKRAQNAKAGKNGLALDTVPADKIIAACTARLKEIAKAKAPAPATGSLTP